MLVGDRFFHFEGLSGGASGKRRLHPGIIDVGMIAGAAIALALPTDMTFLYRGQQRTQVEPSSGTHLLQ
jgi:hypothetical protein